MSNYLLKWREKMGRTHIFCFFNPCFLHFHFEYLPRVWHRQFPASPIKNLSSMYNFFFSCGLRSCPVIIELWSKSQWITLKLQHQRQNPIPNTNFLFLLMPKIGICQLKVIFRFCLFPVSWLDKSCMGKGCHQDWGRRYFPSWSSLIQDGDWDEEREVDLSCWAL